MKHRAFTLVELLVVIAIVGLLSGVAVVATNNARQKAKIAKANADIQQIYKRIDLVRNNNNLVLMSITGSNASDWPCRSRNLDGLATSDSCIISMTNTFATLGITPLPRDPWGHPYLIDENELEGGGCVSDNLYSAGLDFVDSGGAGDDINFAIPMYYCH